ncbi:MAG: excinuclease ABC subunit A [Desulfopila sp.]|jgi:hypothetical protein|nr:excinuclease ABC subunit A [Desulfopila sp.]
MLKKSLLLTTLLIFSAVGKVSAADVLQHLDIDLALQSVKVQEALHPDIRLFFAGENHPPVSKNYGISRTSKRTNSFMKDKIESCEWAFASALLALQDSAIRHGGNAVIEITSNVKNRKNPSSVQYDCLVGSMMVNVAFEAKIVTLAQ